MSAAKSGPRWRRDRAVIGLAATRVSTRARCCQPLPGERIVGITFRGKGVVVHAIDCEALAREYDNQPERWLDLHWHSGAHSPVRCDARYHHEQRCRRSWAHLHIDRRAEGQYLKLDLQGSESRIFTAFLSTWKCAMRNTFIPSYRRSMLKVMWPPWSGFANRARVRVDNRRTIRVNGERQAWSSSGETHEVG
jgi:hypothetical protein